jgi:hypothetical protein
LQIQIQPVLVGTLLFLVFMELLSIVENLIKANPDLARVPLVNKLAQAVAELGEDEGGEQ